MGHMAFDITYRDKDRRVTSGTIHDIIDYRFRVSDGKSTAVVAVGISGAYHDPASALALKRLSHEELVEAAAAWLKSRLDKCECDPFKKTNPDTMIDVPLLIMDYWIEHHAIPDIS